MTAPPILEFRSSAGRMWTGWIILACLFVVSIAGELAQKNDTVQAKEGLKGTSSNAPRLHTDQYPVTRSMLTRAIKFHVLSVRNLGSASALAADDPKDYRSDLKKVKDRIKGRHDPQAAAIRVQIAAESGSSPDPADLTSIASSKDPAYRSVAEIYGATPLTGEQLASLLSAIPENHPCRRITLIEVARKMGSRDPYRGFLSPMESFGLRAVTVVSLLMIPACLGLWAVFFALRTSGSLKPQGLPMPLLDRFESDLLATRGAQLFGSFFGIQIVVAMIAYPLKGHVSSEALASLLMTPGMLFAVVLLSRQPIRNRLFSMALLGCTREDLGRKILWGAAAFVAELPVVMGIAALGEKLFPGAPTPTHPATTALESSHDPLTVLSIVLFAVVMAPFWEEIFFRGILFPAIRGATGKLVFAAVASSFLFASIHPQGVSMWLALGSMAGISCALSYHTKSLVPSIVMHGLHNLALIALTLLIS